LKPVTHNAAVRQITTVLKGPVAEAFRHTVPALAELNGNEFYESVMSNTSLLNACMVIFQSRRDAFSHLLIDNRNRPVGDDFVPLKCGRSVHDIVAMVVRSHAKRHFHSSLGGDPNDPNSRANRLYKAINEYLIHEWQVAMVPHYAPLPVDKVVELGPAILEARDPQALERLTGIPVSAPVVEAPPPADEPVMVAVTPPPRPAPAAPLGRSKDEDYWWETLHDPMVRRALTLDEGAMRETISALANIGDATRKDVMSDLGLSMSQAAVVLATAFQVMGRNGFNAIFGSPGKPPAVRMFAERLAATDQRKRNDLNGLAAVVTALLQQQGARPAGLVT